MCVLLLSLIFWLPIFSTIYYDGIARVLSWPSLFYWFLLTGVAMVGFAIAILRQKDRVGAETMFHDGGFTIAVRTFFQKRRVYRLDWREIEQVKLVEAPRGGDVLAFRLTHDAAVREGLIQPETRADASEKLVPRAVNYPIRLSRISVSDATARFTRSAENAGARLVEQSGFNAVVVARYVWSVEWP